jgi:two-component system response regulator CpxR
MQRLLLADDDRELCEMLKSYLATEGFELDSVYDGADAVTESLTGSYRLVILDVMLPSLSGLDALKQIRRKTQVPVLILTARGEDVDSVVGLELGADDYLAKPCNPRVLSARIRAILRRSQAMAPTDTATTTLVVGDVELQPFSRTVSRDRQKVTLTSTEFAVLEVLMRNSGQVVTKNALSELALGRKLGRFDRSLDMHISNVRRKMGFANPDSDRIKTIRNVGYLYTR